MSIGKLLDAGLLRRDESLTGRHKGKHASARVMADGRIEVLPAGTVFKSLSLAANQVTGRHTNGWLFWHVVRGGHEVPIADLRDWLVEG